MGALLPSCGCTELGGGKVHLESWARRVPLGRAFPSTLLSRVICRNSLRSRSYYTSSAGGKLKLREGNTVVPKPKASERQSQDLNPVCVALWPKFLPLLKWPGEVVGGEGNKQVKPKCLLCAFQACQGGDTPCKKVTSCCDLVPKASCEYRAR